MNVEIVLFAIQAGVRLYAAGRKAYVEVVLGRPLILPLPSGPGINVASAHEFFTNDDAGCLIAAKEENSYLQKLLGPAGDGTLSAEGEQQLLHIYFSYLRELKPELFNQPGLRQVSSGEPTGEEIVALMTVGQWSKGELGDHPSGLQILAGTLVNVAVDYFVYTPGAMSDKRPAGRALKTFLEAMDKIDFADIPPADIAGDLLIAVVDSVGANPELIGNTETEKKMVQNISTVLSLSAGKYLKEVPTEDRWRGSAWLQMIARAVIKGGVDTVLANPKAVLGVSDAEADFVREVGKTVADLVIGEEKLKFEALLSGEGINTIVKSALQAAAKNPDIFRTDNQGLRNIITGVAGGLSSQANLLTGDVFPELARLVLEKSADNLDLLWPEGASEPARHLLITATGQLFHALSEGTVTQSWPTLTKDQLMRIVDVVFGEVVENPDWLLKKTELENDSALCVAVRAALAALQKRRDRLSADTAVAVISEAVKASAVQLAFLRRLPPGGADAGKIAISAAIDAVFDSAFGDGATVDEKWSRARASTLVAMLEVTLDRLAKLGVEQKHIDVLRQEIGGLIDGRLTVEEAGNYLEEKLKAA